MTNRNRTEFTKRIKSLTPTHDMKALKDPATQHMKGERRVQQQQHKQTNKLAAGSSHLSFSFSFIFNKTSHIADDWNSFVITSSVWAAQGLIADEVMVMWSHFATAYAILLQSRSLTKALEEDAAEELRKFAKAVEKVLLPHSSRFLFHMVLIFFFFFFLSCSQSLPARFRSTLLLLRLIFRFQ